MKVSIVIPNYNGKQYMKDCINSLQNQSYTGFEIIVVDNGSLDGSRTYIKENYSNIKLILLDKNYGFSKAVNVGIKESKGEYVVLLNNDTVVEEDWLENLLGSIEKDKQIFSCSSKMIRYNERHLIDDAGDEYTILGKAYKRGDGKSIDLFNESKEVFSACAGAAIYRREIFDEIGYFDESFFAYMEDVDIGYRARIYGYKNMYCHNAIVYHIGSATSGSTKHSVFKVRLAARNNIYVQIKNMPWCQRLFNMPFMLLGWGIKYIYFIKKGFGKEFMEGTREALKAKKMIQRIPYKRKHLKNYFKIQWLLIINTIKILLD